MSTAPKHIIIADDDVEIRTLLSDFLQQYEYQVTAVEDGQALLDEINAPQNQNKFSLAILDVMMPNVDGIEACRKIRTFSSLPIVMLTAVSEDVDRIIGLEVGADDYIAKPFNPRELLARIKAILRRSTDDQVKPITDDLPRLPTYEFNGWKLNTTERSLYSPDSVEVPVSSGVYDLLLAFVEHPQRVLTRDQLMELTRNREYDPYDRSIDVQVSRLRQKLEPDPKKPTLIKTVRTGGYMFTGQVSHA